MIKYSGRLDPGHDLGGIQQCQSLGVIPKNQTQIANRVDFGQRRNGCPLINRKTSSRTMISFEVLGSFAPGLLGVVVLWSKI
jgi:hypothetical protein